MRKSPLSIAAVLLAVAPCPPVPWARRAASGSAAPNIVVIMTDDQTVESLRVMKERQAALVAQGTSFDNSFASFALCCPSRVSSPASTRTTTGCSRTRRPTAATTRWTAATRSGVAQARRLRDDPRRQVPQRLRRPGQAGDPARLDGVARRCQQLRVPVLRLHAEREREAREYGQDPASYQSDVYADKAVEVVRRRAAEKRPFFLWVSFLAPHIGGPPTPGRSALTTLPAPRHLGRFAASPLPTPPSFNEEDVSDKPARSATALRSASSR